VDVTTAIAVLTDALQRCRTEDMRTANVFAALDFLAARASVKWPFEQFRESLNSMDSELWEAEARWQTLNASLNGIKLAITPTTPTQAESIRKREWVFEPPPTRRNKRT
jgi:hypothetical protein